jgi:gamma-glutamyltranspeptidase / glutathione hydrolase
MYEGAWAEALVTAVREAGGSMTMADLASYEPAWSESAHAAYGAFEIHVPGGNSPGGTNLLEAMQLLDRARVRASGPVSESAESFYWVSRVGYLLWVSDFRMADFEATFPEIPMDLQTRRTPEHADRLWALIRSERWDDFVASDPLSRSVEATPAHTDAIVAMDRWGNAAALIHSSNVLGWGEAGLFVGGVSIPDFGRAASRMEGLQPGDRVPNQLSPVLVLRDGIPVLGLAALGAGIHHATMQTMVNVLDYGMDPLSATTAPQIAHFAWPGAPEVPAGTPLHTHLIEVDRFGDALVDSVRNRGQPVVEISRAAALNLSGRVGLAVVNPIAGTATGVGSVGGSAAASGTVRR